MYPLRRGGVRTPLAAADSGVHDATKRFEIEILTTAGLPKASVAEIAEVSVWIVHRVRAETEARSVIADETNAMTVLEALHGQAAAVQAGLPRPRTTVGWWLPSEGAARTEDARGTARRALGRLSWRPDRLVRPGPGTATTGRAPNLPLRGRRGRVHPARFRAGPGALDRERPTRRISP